MAELYRIKEETLVDIADSIRSLTGKSGKISVGNISTEIKNINIETSLPDLNNPATSNEIFLTPLFLKAILLTFFIIVPERPPVYVFIIINIGFSLSI